MSIYGSVSSIPLDQLQQVVSGHPVNLAGRCLACEVEGPCPPRYAALHALAIGYVLPRRQPGATRPELVGLRRVRMGPRPGGVD